MLSNRQRVTEMATRASPGQVPAMGVGVGVGVGRSHEATRSDSDTHTGHSARLSTHSAHSV